MSEVQQRDSTSKSKSISSFFGRKSSQQQDNCSIVSFQKECSDSQQDACIENDITNPMKKDMQTEDVPATVTEISNDSSLLQLHTQKFFNNPQINNKGDEYYFQSNGTIGAVELTEDMLFNEHNKIVIEKNFKADDLHNNEQKVIQDQMQQMIGEEQPYETSISLQKSDKQTYNNKERWKQSRDITVKNESQNQENSYKLLKNGSQKVDNNQQDREVKPNNFTQDKTDAPHKSHISPHKVLNQNARRVSVCTIFPSVNANQLLGDTTQHQLAQMQDSTFFNPLFQNNAARQRTYLAQSKPNFNIDNKAQLKWCHNNKTNKHQQRRLILNKAKNAGSKGPSHYQSLGQQAVNEIDFPPNFINQSEVKVVDSKSRQSMLNDRLFQKITEVQGAAVAGNQPGNTNRRASVLITHLPIDKQRTNQSQRRQNFMNLKNTMQEQFKDRYITKMKENQPNLNYNWDDNSKRDVDTAGGDDTRHVRNQSDKQYIHSSTEKAKQLNAKTKQRFQFKDVQKPSLNLSLQKKFQMDKLNSDSAKKSQSIECSSISSHSFTSDSDELQVEYIMNHKQKLDYFQRLRMKNHHKRNCKKRKLMQQLIQKVPEKEIDILKEEEDELKLTMLLKQLSNPAKSSQIMKAYGYLNTKFENCCPCKRKKVENELKKEHIIQLDQISKNATWKYNNKWRERWDILIIVFAIYNCVELPLEVAYQWRKEFDKGNVSNYLNHGIDSLFLIDIILNFRTSFFNKSTGEEIVDTKQIARYYLKNNFFVDLISTIPFDLIYLKFIDSNSLSDEGNSTLLQIVSMMKIIRVLRLQRLINYMNQSDTVKLSLRLMQSIFLIVLYVHITACFWFFLHQFHKLKSATVRDDTKANLFMKIVTSFYQSVLALLGNDIYPYTSTQYCLGAILIIIGAILQASMFGQVAVIVQSLSRKSQAFQEKIDIANTSMKNMQLNEKIQSDIREFMTKTQSNLDNQKELEEFLKMISPSIRLRVTHHIFATAILQNDIFNEQKDVAEFIIYYLEPRLFLPEDQIISYGQNDKTMYFLANGAVLIEVSDNMRRKRSIGELQQGSYFGEVAVIFGSKRTASVQSVSYCTLARLNYEHFEKLWQYSPDIFVSIKENALKYEDPWIRFKEILLTQVDYFKHQVQRRHQFIKEIQYYMVEAVYQPGSEILQMGENCGFMLFIVNGIVELQVIDEDGDLHTLEELGQGDMIGQYSVLFDTELMFSVIAKTNVRILTLDQDFFMKFGIYTGGDLIGNVELNEIVGLEESIQCAQLNVEKFGIPICDYRIWSNCCSKKRSLREKFMDAVNRVIVFNKLNKKQNKPKIIQLLKDLKMNQQFLKVQRQEQLNVMTQNLKLAFQQQVDQQKEILLKVEHQKNQEQNFSLQNKETKFEGINPKQFEESGSIYDLGKGQPAYAMQNTYKNFIDHNPFRRIMTATQSIELLNQTMFSSQNFKGHRQTQSEELIKKFQTNPKIDQIHQKIVDNQILLMDRRPRISKMINKNIYNDINQDIKLAIDMVKQKQLQSSQTTSIIQAKKPTLQHQLRMNHMKQNYINSIQSAIQRSLMQQQQKIAKKIDSARRNNGANIKIKSRRRKKKPSKYHNSSDSQQNNHKSQELSESLIDIRSNEPY